VNNHLIYRLLKDEQTKISGRPSRNDTGLRLNLHYISRCIDVSMEVLITLGVVEVLTTLFLNRGGFIFNTDSPRFALVARLRGMPWIDSPHTVFAVAHRLPHEFLAGKNPSYIVYYQN
jgi:hypothetical protein